MTLTEAIKHCKEVAEEKKKSAEAWNDVTKRGTVGWTDDDFRKVEINIKKCKKCGEEHQQLAEWLEDYEKIKEKKVTGMIWDHCRVVVLNVDVKIIEQQSFAQIAAQGWRLKNDA